VTTLPVVELEQVRIRLGGRTILDDVTLTIDEGEFIAILGPNGAGKSTLLKTLLGLIKVDAGSIRILGHAPRRGNRDIGYAPQHRTLEADLALRARDVVGFGLDGNHWGIGLPSRKRTALIDKVLREVNALDLANAPVGQLSGGEQQRLLIAQALLTNPRLLLLDEPLANLDISREGEIVSLIANVCHERNVAVMLLARGGSCSLHGKWAQCHWPGRRGGNEPDPISIVRFARRGRTGTRSPLRRRGRNINW
jgi:zinc/manganese transport system ATP-binding protein